MGNGCCLLFVVCCTLREAEEGASMEQSPTNYQLPTTPNPSSPDN
ncbi:MAG: hypothetical protein N2235_11335 [Fischerella sp.]|nr:hypothetical protein [Fischerella sp.]